jgi:hypothetical protein
MCLRTTVPKGYLKMKRSVFGTVHEAELNANTIVDYVREARSGGLAERCRRFAYSPTEESRKNETKGDTKIETMMAVGQLNLVRTDTFLVPIVPITSAGHRVCVGGTYH